MLKRMLLVEDEKDILELLVAIFSDQEEYEIFCAGDGREALKITHSCLPDIIILDVNLPVFCGYDLCRQVKSNPVTKHIKILMLSGMAQRDNFLRAQAEGADGYLTKPFNPSELEEAVNSLFREDKKAGQN
jgi:DNA-binding response OmpR family regulator